MRAVVFLVIALLVPLVGCDEDSNSSSTAPVNNEEAIFALQFNTYVEDGWRTVDAYFITTDISVIPTVIVNGRTMRVFDFTDDECIVGRVQNLPYNQTVQYSVSAGDKTTSGSIEFPSGPYEVRCDGVLLNEGERTTVPEGESYNLSWSCARYDYFHYEWWGEFLGAEDYTQGRSATCPSETGRSSYNFNLKAYSGAMLSPGNVPNVTGDYGRGYVRAMYDYQWYGVETSVSLTSTRLRREPTSNSLEQFGSQFIEMISHH